MDKTRIKERAEERFGKEFREFVEYIYNHLTNKGKMFLRWYDENQNEIEGLSFKEILDEFDKYYNSIFNKRI